MFESRKDFLDIINNYLKDNNGHLISIDSDWGNGKSFFIDKLIKELNKSDRNDDNTNNTNKIISILIDCWEQQGSRNIESILIETIYNELNEKVYGNNFVKIFLDATKENISDMETKEKIKVLKTSISFIGKLCAGGIIPIESIGLLKDVFSVNDIVKETLPDNIFKVYEKINIKKISSKQIDKIKELKELTYIDKYNNDIINEYIIENEFYEILYNLLILSNKKIILIFYELDRCEPDYSMKLINKIVYCKKKFKEFSNGDFKYNFLISVNKYELIQIMKHYYGEHYSAEAFFDKLFDYEFELPKGIDYLSLLNEHKYPIYFDKINKNIVGLLEKDNYRKIIQLHKLYAESIDKFNTTKKIICLLRINMTNYLIRKIFMKLFLQYVY